MLSSWHLVDRVHLITLNYRVTMLTIQLPGNLVAAITAVPSPSNGTKAEQLKAITFQLIAFSI